jgi:hypothetical protein
MLYGVDHCWLLGVSGTEILTRFDLSWLVDVLYVDGNNNSVHASFSVVWIKRLRLCSF